MVVPLENSDPRLRSVVIALISLAVVYVVVVFWLDRRNQVFSQLPVLIAALPAVMACALVSYGVRVIRFRWLLQRAGHALPMGRSIWIYLAGFAFTASPGKLGELIRLRYLGAFGVPHDTAIAEFFYERLFDLIAVLLLSALAIGHLPGLKVAAGFVALVAGSVTLLAAFPGPLQSAAHFAKRRAWPGTADAIAAFANGMEGLRRWLTPPDLAVSLVLSLAAWAITSLGFVWLLAELQADISQPLALAIYPLASLVGAASMLPGGLGSTEIATAVSLTQLGVPLATAALAAVGIRLGTLWFAMLLGMAALVRMEMRQP